MPNVRAIHSVGQSLVTYLTNSYPAELRATYKSEFALLSSEQFAKATDISNTLSLYLYRVTMNEHLRGAKRGQDPFTDDAPLSVDLHYLMTAWFDEAPSEHVVLAWAMRQLQQHPVLDRSSLSPEAEWGLGDVVQLIPAELSTEDIMRIWDALEPSYRLSVSYIARVVRIDGDGALAARPAVATRFAWTDAVGGR